MNNSNIVGSAALIENAAKGTAEPDVSNTEKAGIQIVNAGTNIPDVQLIARDDREIVLVEFAANGHSAAVRAVELECGTVHRQRRIARDGQRVDRQRGLEAGIIQQKRVERSCGGNSHRIDGERRRV